MNPSVLERKLSLDNMYSFTEACIKISELLPSLYDKGHQTVVVPGRGAYPLATGALTLFDSRPLSVGILNLPFTADDSQNLTTAQVREFWVKVLKSHLTGKTSPEFETYHHYKYSTTIQPIARPLSYDLKLCHPKITFIDTAISGRAASEILTSLDAHAIDYHMVLVIDNNGKSLNPLYERAIDDAARLGKLTRVHVDSIYTEDEGIGLLGNTTLMFPQGSGVIKGNNVVASSWFRASPKIPVFDTSKPKVLGIDQADTLAALVRMMHGNFLRGYMFKQQGFIDNALGLRDIVVENAYLTSKEATLATMKKYFGNRRMEVTSSQAIRLFL